jgi:hypothetical protein
LTPALSPTETTSTPASSRMRAVGVSHATTPTIFRPSCFIARSAGRVSFVTL